MCTCRPHFSVIRLREARQLIWVGWTSKLEGRLPSKPWEPVRRSGWDMAKRTLYWNTIWRCWSRGQEVTCKVRVTLLPEVSPWLPPLALIYAGPILLCDFGQVTKSHGSIATSAKWSVDHTISWEHFHSSRVQDPYMWSSPRLVLDGKRTLPGPHRPWFQEKKLLVRPGFGFRAGVRDRSALWVTGIGKPRLISQVHSHLFYELVKVASDISESHFYPQVWNRNKEYLSHLPAGSVTKIKNDMKLEKAYHGCQRQELDC